jgi:CIC family chloride channel protein
VRLSDGSLYAITADELTSVSATLNPETPIERALKPDRLPQLFPDMPLDTALHYFPRWPLLPISNRANRATLEGVLTLDDVLARYRNSD